MGKLLGPKGNSMKRLQENTMTKMAVLGKGSMRDRHMVIFARRDLFYGQSYLNDMSWSQNVALIYLFYKTIDDNCEVVYAFALHILYL